MRGKLIFQVYALAVCFASVLGLTFEFADLGFGVAKTYLFEPRLGTYSEEMLQSDDVFLDRLQWRKGKPLPSKEELQKIKLEFRRVWELEDRRRGNADILKAGFTVITLAVLYALHWFLARRLQQAMKM